MLISVVVPIYQVKPYLRKCIDSILRQTYTNLEVILVDDGSTDGSEMICDDYARLDNRVYVIHKQNGGLVSARKEGINRATGKYVLYIDGDDWIEEDYIENFAVHIMSEETDIIWGLVYYKDYGTTRCMAGCTEYSKVQLKSRTVQERLKALAFGKEGFQNFISFSLCMKCFRTTFLKKIQNSLDDRITYDEDFTCIVRCLASGARITFVRNDGYHYLQRDDSLTHKNDSGDANRIMLLDTLHYLDEIKCEYEILRYMTIKQYQISQIYHGRLDSLQVETSDSIIPFVNAKKGKNIILYGMGNAGKCIFKFLEESKAGHVIGYIDQREKGEIEAIPQYTEEQLASLEYDYIIISTIKQEYITQIMDKLRGIGIASEKIAYVDFLLGGFVKRE